MSRATPIVLIILSACLGYFYIYPTWSGDIANEQQQISSYDQALQAATNFDAEQKGLIAKSQNISQADRDKLESYMPNSVDNIQLILDLNSLANANGLTLSGFTIQDNTANTPDATTGSGTSTAPLFTSSGATNSLSISVNATGTYGSFLNFLSEAELSDRPLDVTSLSLTDSNTGVYTYAITFQIYWLAS